jgi:hypothetical protein
MITAVVGAFLRLGQPCFMARERRMRSPDRSASAVPVAAASLPDQANVGTQSQLILIILFAGGIIYATFATIR